MKLEAKAVRVRRARCTGLVGGGGIGWTVLAVLLAGCGETPPRPSADESVLAPALAPTPPECSTKTLAKGVRDYLDRPEQLTASAAVSEMESGCADGAADVVWTNGWIVLMAMQSAQQAGTAGSPVDGAVLATGVMQFMCSAGALVCEVPPAPAVTAVFGPGGIFAIRGSDADPVVANGAVSFVDFDGQPNQGLWGLETTAATWAAATGVDDLILFYGAPGSGSGSTNELPFGDLQMELHSFPDVQGFATNQVHVGVCFQTDVALPHPEDDETLPAFLETLQREGTLLQRHVVACNDWWSTFNASSLAGALEDAVAFLAGVVLPEPLAAALMTDRKAPSTGGTPIDFSKFTPVATDTRGSLAWVVPPADGDDDEPLAPILVQALSGEGTPMELVEVTLHLVGNSGIPAGASFCPEDHVGPCASPTALTRETLSGFDPVATFDGTLGDQARIFKPGGYELCARGGLAGFTFDEVCQTIHIKN